MSSLKRGIPGRFAGWALLFLLPLTAVAQERVRDQAEIRKTLDRILSSPEFETRQPKPDASQTFWSWIARKLGELFELASNLGTAAPAVFWTILIVCVLALTAIFAHGGVILVRALRASRHRKLDTPLGKKPDGDASLLLARACKAVELGQFTEAIRLCHRAALMGLDRRGLIRFQECLTSGDYRGQLHSREAERALFVSLTRIYEPAYFGKAASSGADASASLDLARKLAQEPAA